MDIDGIAHHQVGLVELQEANVQVLVSASSTSNPHNLLVLVHPTKMAKKLKVVDHRYS